MAWVNDIGAVQRDSTILFRNRYALVVGCGQSRFQRRSVALPREVQGVGKRASGHEICRPAIYVGRVAKHEL
jgi:hypothetical protein